MQLLILNVNSHQVKGYLVIQLKKIEKYYENGVVQTFVLRQIDLEINEGEFVSVMGPSGAGKSTLLHILGMLDSSSGGEYYFYDQPVHALGEKELTELHRDHIGFVFQSYHLIEGFGTQRACC